MFGKQRNAQALVTWMFNTQLEEILPPTARGNRWRGGGMFMLREHALRIGRQHYRKNRPIEGLRP